MFKKGGNAVDAAITTNLVQGIVAPETCGIGGDLFALIWVPGKNKPEFLDASGYAGSLVNIESLANYKNIPLNHPLSVTIPGAVAGWIELSNKYGNLPIKEILDIHRREPASRRADRHPEQCPCWCRRRQPTLLISYLM